MSFEWCSKGCAIGFGFAGIGPQGIVKENGLLRNNKHYPYKGWQLNWTLRGVFATAVFAGAALASAYGATLSLDKAKRAERSLIAEAGELQLLAEYTSYMAKETAAIRQAQKATRAGAEASFLRAALDGDDPLDGFGDFGLSDLKTARTNAEERQCLAQAIYYEARSERRVGQLAVADVILNRVDSSIYPDTICDVVFQGSERETGCQFSFTCDGSMDGIKLTQRNKRWKDAQDMAGAILAGMHVPVSRQATHYHADYVDPPWAENLSPTATIGTHKFYRFNTRGISYAAPAGM